MPVKTFQNTTAGPAVFFDSDTNHQIEWSGAGDYAGNDVQMVPDYIQENPYFNRAVRQGIFKEISLEEANDRFDLQQGAWEARQKADAEAGKEFFDGTSQKNDVIALQCLGPSPSGRGQCPEQVPIKVRDLEDRPPLCRLHSRMKDQFFPTPDPDGRIGESGKVAVKWSRPTIDTR